MNADTRLWLLTDEFRRHYATVSRFQRTRGLKPTATVRCRYAAEISYRHHLDQAPSLQNAGDKPRRKTDAHARISPQEDRDLGWKQNVASLPVYRWKHEASHFSLQHILKSCLECLRRCLPKKLMATSVSLKASDENRVWMEKIVREFNAHNRKKVFFTPTE